MPVQGIKIDVRFSRLANGDLEIDGVLHNLRSRPIHVYNGLWRISSAGTVAADSSAAYSFVNGHRLLLVWGAAPLPSSKTTLFRNVPYVTTVLSAGALPIHFKIPAPLKEYSPYFAEPDGSVFERVEVKEVELVVQILENKEGIQLEETELGGGFRKLQPMAMVESAEKVSTGSHPLIAEVLKRTDSFDRP
jgi:hypothetical protein